jgi:hypothetical protein
MAFERLRGARHDNLGAKVATHGVNRNSDHASLILVLTGRTRLQRMPAPTFASSVGTLMRRPAGEIVAKI